ncbi:beta-lactamase/transpeptidase-like protein [Clohesyomyces aquaticus]|uniref:Beta-lactamase/transpeptidase-like protein n=1 Tax=Clohesyomyces aquaticus TaxID=1231657 RepID=A0A1Y1YLR0_9PLEO|nr:beta-lactamase/transpeptidase-like protein [Clohesyomyces aquaticus]
MVGFERLRSRFRYNNIAFAVLGEIITKVSGRPYHILLQENILAPLGIARTLVEKDQDLLESTSLAYSTLVNGEPYNVPLPGITTDTAMVSAGGLLTTANDLSKYCKFLLESWSAGEERVFRRNQDSRAFPEHTMAF